MKYQSRIKQCLVYSVLTLLAFCFLFIALDKVTVAAAEKEEDQKGAEYEERLSSISGIDNSEYVNLGEFRHEEGDEAEGDLLTNLYYIENANYFLANPFHHKNDSDDNFAGTCTTVSMQLLIGYHNYYSDRRLLPKYNKDGIQLLEDNYGSLDEHPSIDSSLSHDNHGYGRKSIGTSDGVYERIFEETTWADFPALGQAMPNVTDGAKAFLKKDSELTSWVLNCKKYNRDEVLSELSAGRPVIIGFDYTQGHSAHVVVAYGYANYRGELCYITHYGWQHNYAQMLVPESWLGGLLGYQVTMNVDHVHTFIDMGETYKNTFRAMQCNKCGCTTLDDKYIPSLFAGGSGTYENPFLIYNENHLRNIDLAYRSVYMGQSGASNVIDYSFRLMNSIALTNDWVAFTHTFIGDFDGNGYYITYNMYLTQDDINNNADQGLFGVVSKGAKIHDLEFMNCSITSDTSKTLSLPNEDSTRIGIVAGSIDGSSELNNVKVTNPNINCKIKYAEIGALTGSWFTGSARDCVVREVNGKSQIVNNTRGYLGGLAGMGSSISIFSGCEVTISLKNTDFNGDTDMMGEVISRINMSAEEYLDNYGIIANVSMDKGSCLAEGTLITLADGSQKPVEELTGDEMLLVWNMFTGQFDVAPIVFIDTENESEYEVISLDFSNGTAVKVISEHGFWDYNLNRYVYLDRNAAQYIGHWFSSQTIDEDGNMVSERVQLTDVRVQTETIAVYSPVTYGHLCYYVNGMLSMPGGIEGLFNIFEVDPDTMCYDFAQMQEDIEEYGLFTYEEFAESVPVSREVFEAFNGQYLKVAIGKGLIDIPTLEALASRYAIFFD